MASGHVACWESPSLFTGIPLSVYVVALVYVLVRLCFGWREWIVVSCPRRVLFPTVAAATASLYSIRVIENFDTWMYHMNAVKWYGSFGIVPGLALLETRLGWISSWFALDASLNHGLLAERMYSLPGLLVLTLLTWQALECLDALRRRAGALSDVAFLLAFICMFAFCWKRRMIASGAPDFAVIGLTLQIRFNAASIFARSDFVNVL